LAEEKARKLEKREELKRLEKERQQELLKSLLYGIEVP
jgi:hypothetical protein